MNHDLNISVLRNLITTYPEAEDFISERADKIAADRLKASERAAFNRGVHTALSPLTLTFWKQAFEGVTEIFTGHTRANNAPKPETGLGNSFNWATENFRLACCDFIKEKNVPLDIFTDEEQAFIQGKPYESKPSAPYSENNL